MSIMEKAPPKLVVTVVELADTVLSKPVFKDWCVKKNLAYMMVRTCTGLFVKIFLLMG